MTREEILSTTQLFLLDLDGTVYLGDRPIGETPKTLAHLRAMGKRLVFLTNNSSRTRAEYVERLESMGLFEEGDGVYTSAMATAAYLKERYAGKRVHITATAAVEAEFRAAGILDGDPPEVCVLAYDTELTFEKLRVLDYHLSRGAVFLATHPDDVCPTAYGSKPDVGSFLALLERSSGRRPDAIVGKPFPHMANYLSRETGVPVSAMCMVGDRMHTDVRFANAAGMRSVLVLSGETTRESMKAFPDRPDLVLECFDRICGD